MFSPADMSNNYAVLWDMDGVLIDTYEYHYRAWASVLQEDGILFDQTIFRQIFGLKNDQAIQILLGKVAAPEKILEIENKKETAFRQAIQGQVRLLPGVIGWLEGLHQQRILQAIATSAPKENINALLDETHIRPYFSVIVAASGIPGKPDPAVFLKAASLLDVPASNCLVIEDSTAGVQAAKRAGMKCIAVTTTHPVEHLSSADWVVRDLSQIPLERFRTFFT
jgi:beta-phosphoglucomutase family hydrolase